VAVGGRDAAAAGWQEVLAEAADRGLRERPADTVRGTGRRLVREYRLRPEHQEMLRQVIGAVESSWYGGRHPAPGELTGAVHAVRAGIAAGGPLGLRDRLLPRSVLSRPMTSRAMTSPPGPDRPGPERETEPERDETAART
jgi:hypothetical protein